MQAQPPYPDPRDYLPAFQRPRPPLMQACFELEQASFWSFVDSNGRDEEPFGLWMNYFADVYYADFVDADAFRYVLPFALTMWSASLRGDSHAHAGSEEFCGALHAKSDQLRGLLGQAVEAAVIRFLRDSLARFVGANCSLDTPNLSWISDWVGASCGLPALVPAWFRHLENGESDAQVAAYLAYLARFAYKPGDNPLDPDSVEGPEPWHRPDLRGIRWTDESIDVARTHLRAAHLRTQLAKVRDRAKRDSVVAMIAEDIANRADIAETRAAEALCNLATPQPSPYWSDAF